MPTPARARAAASPKARCASLVIALARDEERELLRYLHPVVRDVLTGLQADLTHYLAERPRSPFASSAAMSSSRRCRSLPRTPPLATCSAPAIVGGSSPSCSGVG